jgi:WD40 repeat protein
MRLTEERPARLVDLPGPAAGLFAFSRDGKYLASVFQAPATVSGPGDYALRICEVASGRSLGSITPSPEPLPEAVERRWRALALARPPEPVQEIALSPDGKLQAARIDRGKVRLWDVDTGQEWPRLPPLERKDPVSGSALTFSGDGQSLIVGEDDGSIILWDLHTRQVLRVLPRLDPIGLQGPENVQKLVTSDDGHILAAFCGFEHLRAWDLRSPDPQPTFQVTLRMAVSAALTLSPDGRTVAVSDGLGEIARWNVASGRRLMVTRAPEMRGCFAAISPDGKTVATACWTAVILWNAQTGRELDRIFPAFPAGFVAFSPDGANLVYATYRAPQPRGGMYNLDTFTEPPGFGGEATCFSPDSELLALSGPRFEVVRRATAERLWSENYVHDHSIPAFSIDGKMVAYGCFVHGTGTVLKVKESTTGKEIHRLPSPDSCAAVAFCPDGRTLTLAGTASLQLWDISSWRLLRQLEKPLREPKPSVSDPPETDRRALAVSPDGFMLAVGEPDNTIGLWEIATGRKLGQLQGHHGPILSLAFMPDGRRLLSGSEDTTALVWDLARYRRLVR